MTRKGQCPHCREIIALPEVEFAAAPIPNPSPTPTLQCSCGARLMMLCNHLTDEIETVCQNCASEYVVNRSAAGEIMPCRCGAAVEVPHCALVSAPEVSAPEVSAPEVTPPTSPPRIVVATDIDQQLDRETTEQVESDCEQIDLEENNETERKTEVKPIQATTHPTEDDSPISENPDKPEVDELAEDVPAEDVPAEDVPAEDVPAEDVPAEDELAEDELAEDELAEEQPLADESAEDEPIADELVEVRCPGCRRHYPVPTSELGQTGECECGFTFVMQTNIDALDSAFCENLVPYPPLAIDRTGTVDVSNRPDAFSQPKRESSKPVVEREPSSVEVQRPRLQSAARSIGWVVSVLLITGGVAWFVMRLDRRSGPQRGKIARNDDLFKAIPIPENKMDGGSSFDRDSRLATQVANAKNDHTPLAQSAESKPSASTHFLDPTRDIADELIERQTLDRDDLYRFADSVEALKDRDVVFSVDDLFWLAHTWQSFGERTADHDLASRCYWQAASAYALAETISSIDGRRLAIAKRRNEELSERSREQVRLAKKTSI